MHDISNCCKLVISSPIAAAALATEALAQAIWSSALAIDAYRDGINYTNE